VPEPQAFNLTSALGTLERQLRLVLGPHMRNVRLHPDEISALLNVAQYYQTAVEYGAVRSADIGKGTRKS